MNIQIDKMRDVLIIEKCDGKTIIKGSHLFCGCCGGSIGTLKKKMTFPFNWGDIEPNISDLTLKSSPFGLRHSECRHTMFPCRNVGFIALDVYEAHQKETKTAAE